MAKHTGALRRFGARYGASTRQKLAEIESLQKQAYECPGCKQKKVKRIAAGIWQCRKCGIKFAGKAYTVSKKIKIKEEITDIEEEGPKKRKRLRKKEKEEIGEKEAEEEKVEQEKEKEEK